MLPLDTSTEGPFLVCPWSLFSGTNEQCVRLCYSCVAILHPWLLGKFQAGLIFFSFVVFTFFCLDAFRIFKKFLHFKDDLGYHLWLWSVFITLPGTECYLVPSASHQPVEVSSPQMFGIFFLVIFSVLFKDFLFLSTSYHAFPSSSDFFFFSFSLGWKKFVSCWLILLFILSSEDLNSAIEFSASVSCFLKETQLPLNPAPSSASPSLLFTESHAVLSDLLFHRGHVFSSCIKNTKVRLSICFLKSLKK